MSLGLALGPRADNAATLNGALRASKDLGRALWRRRSGPTAEAVRHQDALCETKVREPKLTGLCPVARDFDRQVAAFRVRVAALNGFTAPGIPVTKIVG
jgi:hypothetical protein